MLVVVVREGGREEGEGLVGLGLGLFSLRDFRPSCSTEGRIPDTDILFFLASSRFMLHVTVYIFVFLPAIFPGALLSSSIASFVKFK